MTLAPLICPGSGASTILSGRTQDTTKLSKWSLLLARRRARSADEAALANLAKALEFHRTWLKLRRAAGWAPR